MGLEVVGRVERLTFGVEAGLLLLGVDLDIECPPPAGRWLRRCANRLEGKLRATNKAKALR